MAGKLLFLIICGELSTDRSCSLVILARKLVQAPWPLLAMLRVYICYALFVTLFLFSLALRREGFLVRTRYAAKNKRLSRALRSTLAACRVVGTPVRCRRPLPLSI